MERRLYFVVGDLLANSAMGGLVAVVIASLIGESWNMFLAMVVGMALGMAMALPCSLLLLPALGAMEVMLPVMLTGMLSGMFISMAAAMQPLGLGAAARTGAMIGVGVLVVTSLLNAWLRTKGKRWTS